MKYPQSVSMPSLVSDWLEEQLEARGIDAELYTRYILSLLHAHTLDVIYPEDDLHFTRLRKEVRRSSGCSSKKARRWRHVQRPDAEQLKRSAAVECLMSASEQNCEVESLVDELCEKLKDINQSPQKDTASLHETIPLPTKISPKELAEKYYAAFPPLCPSNNKDIPKENSDFSIPNIQDTKTSSVLNSDQEIYKETRDTRTFLANFNSQGTSFGIGSSSPKKTKKKPKRDLMKAKASQNFRQRLNFSNSKKDSISSPPFSKNIRNLESAYDMNNWEFFNDNLTCNDNNNNNFSKFQQDYQIRHFQKFQDAQVQKIEMDQTVTQDFENDEENMLYEDLPVDISDLLSDSPCTVPDESNNIVQTFNGKNYNFIPCGTNIISSIWSNDKEKSIEKSFDFCRDSWPDFGNSNERFLSQNEQLFDALTISLMKINHNKETSCFTEISPKNNPKSAELKWFQEKPPLRLNKFGFSGDEDLLTSEKSHFKPINEKQQGEYENGATFVISNKIDKVNYKRSDSGTMYLETEQGQNRKFHEYRDKETSSQLDFVLKFCVSQNDKACQTDTDDVNDCSSVNVKNAAASSCLGEKIQREAPFTIKNNCRSVDGDEDCLDFEKIEQEDYDVGEQRGESQSVMGEISTWKYDTNYCGKCNNNGDVWQNGGQVKMAAKYDVWGDNNCDSDKLRNIWDGKELCHTCLRLNGGGAATPRNSLLREDISQDGEQLLSDLSSLQRSYMESLPPLFKPFNRGDGFNVAMEMDDDVYTSFYDASSGRSLAFSGTGLWSFASRLEEDCLGTMTSLPTLRSVTL